ncbi:MAG: SDR family oxidoreductase [Anaerolineae bacterium]|nr:SDR family oxidoreductase [Anaerolineae bacterium]
MNSLGRDQAAAKPERWLRCELADLRRALSVGAGRPLIVTRAADPRAVAFARREDVAALVGRGAVALEGMCWAARAYCEAHAGRIDTADPWAEPAVDSGEPLPRVVLDPELGLCAAGRSAAEAAETGEGALRALQALAGEAGDEGCSASAMELAAGDGRALFSGEVALVTGAASGIGRACVEAFLARGAAVVGLDINPIIAGLHARPDFLGLRCDLTDEAAVGHAFEAAVRAFGGVDMLVSNAGVFPAGCPIESLTTAEWERVMQINLDANLVLFREAYPLLKEAPRYGRVVVVSSRNVPAPGPGAVAYSASKAALTQMARVAALEWGKDGVRVNIVNPHAVFDTGIWTEEVLQARAAHYKMTVAEYKRHNVLRVEVTSHDVAELVAEMCGPLFAKSTGAQVPIDGGSDRVI